MQAHLPEAMNPTPIDHESYVSYPLVDYLMPTITSRYPKLDTHRYHDRNLRRVLYFNKNIPMIVDTQPTKDF